MGLDWSYFPDDWICNLMPSWQLRSMLPGAFDQPFLAKLSGYFLVGYRASDFGVGLAALNGLQDIQVVPHIVQTTVVGQTVKKRLDALLDMHFHISR